MKKLTIILMCIGVIGLTGCKSDDDKSSLPWFKFLDPNVEIELKWDNPEVDLDLIFIDEDSNEITWNSTGFSSNSPYISGFNTGWDEDKLEHMEFIKFKNKLVDGDYKIKVYYVGNSDSPQTDVDYTVTYTRPEGSPLVRNRTFAPIDMSSKTVVFNFKIVN